MSAASELETTLTPEPDRALVLDIDGAVAPLGPSRWGDDVVAGTALGTPVTLSPTLCNRLDELASHAGVAACWLTDWTPAMRFELQPMCGRGWPHVADRWDVRPSSDWWKWTALRDWLDLHAAVRRVAWCDDHLAAPVSDDDETTRAGAFTRELRARGIAPLLIAPATQVGLTPTHLARVTAWLAPADPRV